MNTVSVARPMAGEDCSTEASTLDDDIPPLSLQDYSDDDLSIFETLPTDGYRIYDERPDMADSVLPLRHAPSRFLSLSSPENHNPAVPSFQGRVVTLGRCLAKNWINMMLVFVPLGIIAPELGFSHAAVFILNSLAVIPLADILCKATEHISTYFGETTGALLNITMGNGTEVVILHALMQRQYMIVRTSLLGSITVNVSLVLGLAIFAGELSQPGQPYNTMATRMTACLLCLSTISLMIPSVLNATYDDIKPARDILNLSRGISMVLILVYIVYLLTQIKSTKYAYKPLIEVELDHPCESRYLYGVDMGCSAHHPDFQPVKSTAQLKKVWPLLLLLISTFLISICAKYLVESIDPLVEHSGLSKTTIGLIVLPLLGNAAELISAIMFASRKQMDLAFAVSIGSAIQIAIFITPLMVMIGWGLHKDMALHFTSFEAITLVATTFLFGFMALDDRCSPMKAALLCAGYVIIALGSYFYPNE